jgi:hypothetical protein
MCALQRPHDEGRSDERTPRRTWVAPVLTTVAAAALLAGGVAYATIPDANGVIHGCYQTSKGDLREIDSSSSTCKNGETALDWNQTGPQGPSGPRGPSDPWFDRSDGFEPFTDVTPVTLTSVTLPAGHFTLQASGEMIESTSSFEHPRLRRLRRRRRGPAQPAGTPRLPDRRSPDDLLAHERDQPLEPCHDPAPVLRGYRRRRGFGRRITRGDTGRSAAPIAPNVDGSASGGLIDSLGSRGSPAAPRH